MAIWSRTPNLEQLVQSSQNTDVSHMGIEYWKLAMIM